MFTVEYCIVIRAKVQPTTFSTLKQFILRYGEFHYSRLMAVVVGISTRSEILGCAGLIAESSRNRGGYCNQS